MATNVVRITDDGLEKQPSVNKKEKYGHSARKVHKKKDDPRRIAAKQFLLGIASNVDTQTQSTSLEAEIRLDSDVVHDNPNNQRNSSNMSELATKLLGHHSLTSSLGADVVAVGQSTSECKIPPVRHPVVRSYSNIESPSQRRKIMGHAKWNTYEGGSLFDFPNMKSTSSKKRFVYILDGAPLVVSSVVHYQETTGKLSRGSVSGASKGDHFDVEEILPHDREVSLSHLLDPVWAIADGTGQQQVGMDTMDDSGRVHSPPEDIAYYSFPYSFFSSSHSASQVIHQYHPMALDNREYFVGKNNTVVALSGYKVTIMMYAKGVEIKRGINEQFKDVYPHITITLSKIRSIKREMKKIAEAVELDLLTVAYAYVYFEKLILMGKVDKPKRKILAGACLLLSAKMHLDLRHGQAKELLEEIATVYRISSKDVIALEFPVLVVLQFSLLVPSWQVQDHLRTLNLPKII